jgi:pimeloyl-ACP methyl ester carboxylesterase
LRRDHPGASIAAMPMFETDRARIHYEVSGNGFPLLLFAPGGMRSSIEFWQRAPFNPIRELSSDFKVIAMDQRNAGHSHAGVSASDGWHTYTADHVALLDHLGVERCHLLGGCIGGSYCLGLMQAAPGRVAAAVLQQPIGLSAENRPAFYTMFDSWAQELQAQREGVDANALAAMRENMYGGDFTFNVTREFVRGSSTPMLVLMGNDLYHPSETSREIVALSKNAELVERWKDPEVVPATVEKVRAFLKAHTQR